MTSVLELDSHDAEAFNSKADVEPLRGLRVAYLVNQYPQPSQSFIRREIAGLEAQGATVDRFTLRRYQGPLVDPHDQEEQRCTQAVLDAGCLGLLRSTFRQAVAQPFRFVSVLRRVWRLGRRSDRGLLHHLAYLAEACALLPSLRAREIQHLHAHFGTNAATVALICRWLGGPSFSFTVHGPEEFDKPEFLHLREKLADAAMVVAISEFGRSQLWRVADWADWTKVEIVHCGVDASFLEQPVVAPPMAPRLVCVARLHEQKGLPVLLAAAERLHATGRPFELTVIGDGPLRAPLERRIAAAGLGDCIRLVGWRSNDEVRQAMLDARALVLPSFAEGLPVVLMEALALHRPAVTTYVAGIPELIEPGVNGWLVPAGAIEPLVEAMAEALDADPSRLAEMGAAGQAAVAARHVSRNEADRLGRCFLRLIEVR